ncbi:MAG: DUF1501 domain-containing protein [Akkermansiaceae bacterium]|tara:strand:+ start:12583 stop:14016 length:1434 start_codon:yes stop_codon:yes gene_type:complete
MSTPLEFENRRDFLKKLGAASAATLTMGAPRLFGNEAIDQPAAKADCCILIWMAGGMAAPDTFDPKHYEPFRKGLPVSDVGSTFPAIPTSVSGINFTEGFKELAKVMDRGTLIRSAVQPDLGHILHSRHQYHWHTGYVPPQTVAAPHIGAWMAKVLGQRNDAMPAFIDIGQRLEGVGEKEELKAFHTGGFFGSEFGPFLLPYPDQAVGAVQPPEGMTPGRFANRYKFYQKLVTESKVGKSAGAFQQESMLRSMDKAHRLLSSKEASAFDLTQEPEKSAAPYGKGRFGQGCLLARRLAESGARFIEVTTEYQPFKTWDTHEKGHTTVKRVKSEIDRPIAQLIRDLEERGMLDRTLVILASEFSRDMMIEGVPGSNARDQTSHKVDIITEMKHYGQHRHFTGGTSVLMFGGGVKKGFQYGRTANERPFIAVENPLGIEDLHATIFHSMGISPKTNFDIEGRPFYATKDGIGKPALNIFA